MTRIEADDALAGLFCRGVGSHVRCRSSASRAIGSVGPAMPPNPESEEAGMTDHLADVKKYAKHPVNEAALNAMAKTYRLVMSQSDTKYVACSDPAERDRVRDNFLKKKLGLSSPDLDAAIKTVCESMKSDRTKSRLTFYYLLAEHYGKLGMFG